MYGPGAFLYLIFLTIGWILMVYTLNFYYLAYQSRNNIRHERKRRQKIEIPSNPPVVTIQLPLYNEKYVAKRLIDAVCMIDYPKEKFQIQVLDDSDDDTAGLIKSIVDEYRFKGFDIVHMHRTDKSGYKAGALKEGIKDAKGEFVAIFDADFIPPVWFLKNVIGHFYAHPKLGFVQCKWGHVNENYSTLTEAQAVSLDLHFLIEQKAKSLTNLYMNFNGTAGIWRTSCINDAGGWHTSTLVEDLDLSYRVQMKGWKCLFLEDVVVDAELPVQMNAAKRQQFRWAKGSIQVALKLLSDVMLHRSHSNRNQDPGLHTAYKTCHKSIVPYSISNISNATCHGLQALYSKLGSTDLNIHVRYDGTRRLSACHQQDVERRKMARKGATVFLFNILLVRFVSQ